MPSLDEIRRALATHAPEIAPDSASSRAAVAMCLRERGGAAEVLFIERARREGDPWSGHMAFPGGRVDRDDRSSRRAAERETFEEVGMSLLGTERLGRLDDMYGQHAAGHPSLVISAFVYHVPEAPPLVLSDEVEQAFWFPLAELLDPGRHVEYRFGPASEWRYPGILVGVPQRHVVWGLTYRFLEAFFAAVGRPLPARPVRLPPEWRGASSGGASAEGARSEPQPSGGRTPARVGTVVLPEIRTISNFRDVGGCATGGGRRVRRGVLFRSGHLGSADAGDLARLAALGIRTVIDFRGPQDEDGDGAGRLPPGAQLVRLPIGDPAGASDIRDLLYRADAAGLERILGGGGAERMMCEAAAGLATDRRAEFGALLRGLAHEHPLPALMHCSAGKDRTGWAASLVLLVLGASEDEVIEHYLLSNAYRRAENERTLANPRDGLDPEWIRPFLEVRAEYARAALDAVAKQFGSFEAYVESGLAVDAATRERLRARLLE